MQKQNSRKQKAYEYTRRDAEHLAVSALISCKRYGHGNPPLLIDFDYECIVSSNIRPVLSLGPWVCSIQTSRPVGNLLMDKRSLTQISTIEHDPYGKNPVRFVNWKSTHTVLVPNHVKSFAMTGPAADRLRVKKYLNRAIMGTKQ